MANIKLFMPGLNAFLVSPVFDQSLLTQGLVLFTLFLIVIRFLPDFWRNLILLLVSLFLILVATSPIYVFYFFAFSVVLYLVLFWIQENRYKKELSYLVAGIVVILYFFLLDLPAWKTSWTGQMVHRFGIAYSLIRFLSLILDVGRGIPLPANFLKYLVYTFFTPTFFQGPIERLGEFSENLSGRQPLTLRGSGSQIIRILGAFLKGWVVLHFLEIDWKAFFDYPQQFSYRFLLWGMYARAIGFYLFVSAANDLTIACSALAGYRIHENYHYPYFKRNLAEFWRSWHMTLVRFLRDYIYIPLGGNRRHVYLNYLIVFFAIAMWHVTSKAFLIWGLWHGVGMCVLKLWQNFWKKRGTPCWVQNHPHLIRILSTLLTFHFVALSWLPFWGGHPQGISMILRLLSGNRWKLFEW